MATFVKQIVVSNGWVQAATAANIGSSDLVATGVTAGTYGDSSHTLTITVDTAGRISSITTNAISSSSAGGVDNQTAATYSIPTSDKGKILTYSYSGNAHVGLPSASTAGSSWYCCIENRGTGILTLQPSGLDHIDGSGLALNISPNQGLWIYSDGTGWYTERGGGGNSYAWTTNANTFTTGVQTIQTGSDSNTALILQGNSLTQSADVFQIKNSSGNVILSVNGDPTYCEVTWPQQNVQMFAYSNILHVRNTVSGQGEITLGVSGGSPAVTLVSGGIGYYGALQMIDSASSVMMTFQAGFGNTYFDAGLNFNHNFRTQDGSGTHYALTLDPSGKVTKFRDSTTAGNGLSSILASVALTGQTGAIATTNLLTPPADGVYRISLYWLCTTADTNTSSVNINFGWTDDVQAQSIATAKIMTLGNFNEAQFLIRAKASGNITYSTSIGGTNASGVYSMWITVERLA